MVPSSPLDDVTPKSTTTLLEQCLPHIDNEALAESMRVLRSRRNSLAPISRIPPEILATIFGHIVENKTSRKYQKRPACLIVTHICRHWREVALECPSLWAFISWNSARWVGICLERSKKAPLVFLNTVKYNLARDSLQQALSQLPRIKVLRLPLFSSDVDRVLDYLSSQPAPLLQSFKFSVAGPHRNLRTISDAIFQGQAPLLRRLKLINCRFSPTSCIFSGLRILYVKEVESTSISELLPALRRMPALEQLTLAKELPSIIAEENKLCFDRVPLVRLQCITLDVTIQTAAYLFARLVLPDDTRISLNLTEIQGYQGFSDLFSAMYKGPGKCTPFFRSLDVTYSSHGFVAQFSKSTECRPSYREHCCDDMQLWIQFNWGVPQSPVIFDICRMVTQGKFHSIFVSAISLPGHFWRAGSTILLELEEIHVQSHLVVGGLFAALRIEGTQSTDIAFRSLQVLELEEISFRKYELEDLHNIIAMRSRHGTSLRQLRFTNCKGLHPNQVQLLKEVVEDVDLYYGTYNTRPHACRSTDSESDSDA
jgi:hypothetical protein